MPLLQAPSQVVGHRSVRTVPSMWGEAMSVLLTDEAVRASWRAEQPTTYASIIETFLRFHATEGRAALADIVEDAIALCAPSQEGRTPERAAQSVVAALFGEAATSAPVCMGCGKTQEECEPTCGANMAGGWER